jgi:glutamate synthase (NADPH/NADH) small chain
MDPFKRIPFSKLLPDARKNCFDEVALGYDEEQAVAEASRCINCRNSPCMNGCPVEIKISEFIQLIKNRDFDAAYLKIAEDSNLPAICGRVCPQEDQCEKFCLRGIRGESVAIGALERFAADRYMAGNGQGPKRAEPNGKKVAVVGAGPAGLSCAADLAKSGYSVMIFEALHKPGGVLSYGIPEFRLPKDLVHKEIDNLRRLGVEFSYNVLIGRSLTIENLFEDGYGAVFIGSGAGLPQFLNIKGENLNGVYSANEYLTRSNLLKAFIRESPTPIKYSGRVAVIGGGNVAMDAARTALRLGADEITVVYRRGREELPARLEEIENAIEEGVKFEFLTAPTEILHENNVITGMNCIRMELAEPDESGRRRPKVIKDSDFTIPVDIVIVAIGQRPNPLLGMVTPGLKTESWGGIIVNEKTMETCVKGVYAGGDAVSGAATVILAMGAGKTAAKSINKALS